MSHACTAPCLPVSCCVAMAPAWGLLRSALGLRFVEWTGLSVMMLEPCLAKRAGLTGLLRCVHVRGGPLAGGQRRDSGAAASVEGCPGAGSGGGRRGRQGGVAAHTPRPHGHHRRCEQGLRSWPGTLNALGLQRHANVPPSVPRGLHNSRHVLPCRAQTTLSCECRADRRPTWWGREGGRVCCPPRDVRRVSSEHGRTRLVVSPVMPCPHQPLPSPPHPLRRCAALHYAVVRLGVRRRDPGRGGPGGQQRRRPAQRAGPPHRRGHRRPQGGAGGGPGGWVCRVGGPSGRRWWLGQGGERTRHVGSQRKARGDLESPSTSIGGRCAVEGAGPCGRLPPADWLAVPLHGSASSAVQHTHAHLGCHLPCCHLACLLHMQQGSQEITLTVTLEAEQ